MNQNNQFPFGQGVPMPMMLGIPSPAPAPTKIFAEAEVPPIRVVVAYKFLGELTEKTRPIVTHSSGLNESNTTEVLPGQHLTSEETRAQNSALGLLISFFEGTMEPSIMDNELRKERQALVQRGGTVSECPQCDGRKGNTSCRLCGGCGEVRITPNIPGSK